MDDLKDQLRKRRLITETKHAKIKWVVIENDPCCSYDEKEAETTLYRGTIEAIIHEHLKMKKLVGRWVPHKLTEQNRRDHVRICSENLAKFDDGIWVTL